MCTLQHVLAQLLAPDHQSHDTARHHGIGAPTGKFDRYVHSLVLHHCLYPVQHSSGVLCGQMTAMITLRRSDRRAASCSVAWAAQRQNGAAPPRPANTLRRKPPGTAATAPRAAAGGAAARGRHGPAVGLRALPQRLLHQVRARARDQAVQRRRCRCQPSEWQIAAVGAGSNTVSGLIRRCAMLAVNLPESRARCPPAATMRQLEVAG